MKRELASVWLGQGQQQLLLLLAGKFAEQRTVTESSWCFRIYGSVCRCQRVRLELAVLQMRLVNTPQRSN